MNLCYYRVQHLWIFNLIDIRFNEIDSEKQQSMSTRRMSPCNNSTVINRYLLKNIFKYKNNRSTSLSDRILNKLGGTEKTLGHVGKFDNQGVTWLSYFKCNNQSIFGISLNILNILHVYYSIFIFNCYTFQINYNRCNNHLPCGS